MIDEQTVIDAIVTILEGVTFEDGNTFKAVYDYIPNQYDSYPLAYVVPASWDEQYRDLRDTRNDMSFSIGLVFSLSPDMEQGQKKLRKASKAVRDEIKNQTNIDLDGSVDWGNLTSGNYTYDTKEQKVAICEMTIDVTKSYSRY